MTEIPDYRLGERLDKLERTVSEMQRETEERIERNRAKRRPDLEVCLYCGAEVAPAELPDSWSVVTDDQHRVVGFQCEKHPT